MYMSVMKMYSLYVHVHVDVDVHISNEEVQFVLF